MENGSSMSCDFQFYLKCESSEGTFKLKCAELRKCVEKALMDFFLYCQGDDELDSSDDDHRMSSLESAEENEIGFNVEHSLKIFSTDFF